MKIKVTHVGDAWQPSPDADPLYTIHIEGNGEPQRTYDAALAVVGTHEAEYFKSKKGKVYWRTPKPKEEQASSGAREFKADPIKQESIEWQACLKAAVEVVRDYNTLYFDEKSKPSLADYKKQVVDAVVTFTQTIKHKPESLVAAAVTDAMTQTDLSDDAIMTRVQQAQFEEENFDGDVDVSKAPEVTEEDLPPAEQYNDLSQDDINLDDIPF